MTRPALAQPAPRVAIECGLSQTRMTVGDQVDFQIQVRHPDDHQIGPLPADLDFGKLEILDQNVENTPPVDGQATTLFRFRITAFEVGVFDTPAIQISYLSASDAEPQEVSCNPITIRVETVLPEDAEDLQDIKLPLDVPADASFWWLWVLLAGLAAGLAFWYWRRYKTRKELVPGPPVPSLPPYEEAVAALLRLKELELPRLGETKRHYVELSEIVRRYIERRFGVVASEMTSRQILRELRSQTEADGHGGELAGLLRDCDLVKFAKFEPSLERSRVLLELARTWLQMTRPRPTVETETSAMEPAP